MAFVHASSCECNKSELDLFTVPPTQTALEDSQWIEHRPITALTDNGPIEFLVPGSGDEYVSLSQSYFQVTAQILKPDGENLIQTAATDPDIGVGPINLWLHSIFSQIDVSLNERLITPSTNTYPYRAYLETLLSYGPAAKGSQLQGALWYKDTAGHMDSTSYNSGYTNRQKWTKNSKDVTMYGIPHLDLWFQDRLILNGVNIKMRLI